jgi:hypothetical protein
MGMINWTRIKNDINGNPRVVCHYLSFIRQDEIVSPWVEPTEGVSAGYALALKRAKRLGGKKFHNKQYGGGIVFQCTYLEELEAEISRILEEV